MVPWVPWYTTSPPPVPYYWSSFPVFSGFPAVSVGRHRSVFREKARKTRLFRVPVRVLLCHQGTYPGSGSRIPGFRVPIPNKTESISQLFDRTAEPGKEHFLAKSRIPDTQ